MTIPRTIVLDVNETLTDQSSFATRLEQVGAPPSLAQAWYGATLRDGFALTVVGSAAAYAQVARDVLTGLLAGLLELRRGDRRLDVDGAVDHVMAGFESVDPHPDVVPGLRALADAGHRLVTLSNGSTEVAAGMLRRHDAASCVSLLLSAEDAGAWKPAARAYAHAAERTGVPAAELLMVAVHPWDLDGAARAGLQTAFVDRTGAPWPSVFRTPDLRVASLEELAARLA